MQIILRKAGEPGLIARWGRPVDVGRISDVLGAPPSIHWRDVVPAGNE